MAKHVGGSESGYRDDTRFSCVRVCVLLLAIARVAFEFLVNSLVAAQTLVHDDHYAATLDRIIVTI